MRRERKYIKAVTNNYYTDNTTGNAVCFHNRYDFFYYNISKLV